MYVALTTVDTRIRAYDLADRYRPTSATLLLGGVHAVARLIVEQRERDRARGLHAATFVSGYQGSPLGGLDLTLASISELRERPDFALVPAVNEEIAATSVWGSQLPLPDLEAADPDALPGSARTGVRPDERPVVLGALALEAEVVHQHLHVRERDHERPRRLGDGRSPDGRRAPVDRERPVRRVVRGDALGILAAPRIGVPLNELA